jgi:hypothetical protein
VIVLTEEVYVSRSVIENRWDRVNYDKLSRISARGFLKRAYVVRDLIFI